jgi:hypothetical protein
MDLREAVVSIRGGWNWLRIVSSGGLDINGVECLGFASTVLIHRWFKFDLEF